MAYFKIGSTDFSDKVKSMKVDMEVLVADNSGRDAAGNTFVDIVNRKYKLEMVFRPMNDTEMAALLNAVRDYVISVTFYEPRTRANKTITCYIGTPMPEFYTLQNGKILYKELSLNFIEM